MDPSVAKLREIFGSDGKFVWDFLNDGCSFNYQDGPGEQLTNGDFEAGGAPPAAPPNWTPGSAATLTTQAGTRTGGAGTKVMRVAIDGPDTLGYATQGAATVGARYCLEGWARGDGVNGQPRAYNQSTVLWTGTTSNVWQYFKVFFTAGFSIMRAWVSGGGATPDYAEFDDWTLTELPGYALCPNLVTPGTMDLTEIVASSMPWRNPTAWNGGLGAQWDRSSNLQMLSPAVGSGIFGRLAQDSPFTIAMTAQVLNTASGDWLLAAGRTASNVPQHGLFNLSGNYRATKKEDSGVSTSNTDNAVNTNRHSLIWSHTGVANSWYIDGAVTAINGSACDRGPTTLDEFILGAKINNAVISAWISAVFVEAWGATRDCSGAEALEIHNYLSGKVGGLP